MVELELTPDRLKMIATRYTDSKKDWEDRFDPVNAKSRRAICVALSVADTWLLSAVESARVAGRSVRLPIEKAPAEKSTGFTIRPIGASRDSADAKRIECDDATLIREHLHTVPVSHVIEWAGTESLCCLDIDYHDTKPPERSWLETLVLSRLNPKPYAWHFSRSGGLHVFFISDSVYSAEELAAVAALRFRTIDATAGLELKHVVRGPGAESVTVSGIIDSSSSVLGEWFASTVTDEAARDEWLDSRDLRIDTRYDHSYCPICPTPDEPGAKRDPVCVSESGIYCFVCEGKSRSIGSRRPGFAPWSAVLGAPSSGDLGCMIRRLCHWGHAKHVLCERYGMPERLARLAYKAALKTFHAGKPTENLIGCVFNPHLDSIARSNNQWMKLTEAYTFPKDIVPILSLLPVAQHWDVEKNQSRVSQAAVSLLQQPVDQTEWGYPNIECVHGTKIAAQFLTDPTARTVVAVVNPELRRKSPRYIPRYVLRTERLSESEAWSRIEAVVPRIDRKLVKVALCAFGSAQETRAGLTPIVFVEGPTGAAKTSTIKLAAAIYGARTQDCLFDRDINRFRQSLYQGSQEGPALLLNELLKDAARSRDRLTPREAMDPILNLTCDSSSWLAYRGPVRFGRVPSVWITEPVCPLTIRDEAQLARRIRHWVVEGRKDEWKGTLAAAKLFDLHLLRLVSDSVNDACNAILSYVCDEFFSVPMTWDEQADRLGAKTIEDSDAFEDLTPKMLEFFKVVCDAPDLPEKLAGRYGVGYKQIKRNEARHSDLDEESDILSLYSMFADQAAGPEWLNSRRLQEKDWSGILKTDAAVHLDMKNDGFTLFLRFRVGPAKRPLQVNGDIVRRVAV